MHNLNIVFTCAHRTFKQTEPNSDSILKLYWPNAQYSQKLLLTARYMSRQSETHPKFHEPCKCKNILRSVINGSSGNDGNGHRTPLMHVSRCINGRPEDPAAHSRASGQLRGHLFYNDYFRTSGINRINMISYGI